MEVLTHDASHRWETGDSLTVSKVFATWADDGSWQAFVARVAHLAQEKHLNLRILHGDGTHTVTKKGAMGWATPATNTRRGRKSSRSRLTMVMPRRVHGAPPPRWWPVRM